MIEKFECSKCGNCCRDFSIRTKQEIPSFYGDMFQVNKLYLPVFDWEKEVMEKFWAQFNVGKIFYDLKSNLSIIVKFTTKLDECPMLKNNMCIIYEQRPTIYRLFPCPYGEPILAGRHETMSFHDICPRELPPRALHKKLGFDNVTLGQSAKVDMEFFQQALTERYGEAFYYHRLYNIINHFILQFIKEKNAEGKIRVAK